MAIDKWVCHTILHIRYAIRITLHVQVARHIGKRQAQGCTFILFLIVIRRSAARAPGPAVKRHRLSSRRRGPGACLEAPCPKIRFPNSSPLFSRPQSPHQSPNPPLKPLPLLLHFSISLDVRPTLFLGCHTYQQQSAENGHTVTLHPCYHLFLIRSAIAPELHFLTVIMSGELLSES